MGLTQSLCMYVSPFQGLCYTIDFTQDFVSLRPELLHNGTLPLKSKLSASKYDLANTTKSYFEALSIKMYYSQNPERI